MSKRSAFCCRCIGVAAVVILIFYACDVSAQCIVETPLVQPPGDIALALDGTIWYVTAKIDNSLSPPKVVGLLGRVTPAGSVVEKTIGFSQPNAITLDPNGNVWFTDIQYNVIYRYVPSTDAFTSYSVMPASLPYDITLGPDGNLWFTTHSGFLGRITVNGTVTLFPLQEIGFQITAGPDGNLWFGSDEKLVQVTSTGQTARFPLPSGTRAYGLTPGPDGAIWFTDRNQPRIGRFALTGQTRFFTPTASGLLHSIAAGTDGNLWFTIETGDKIGKVTPSGPTPISWTGKCLGSGDSRLNPFELHR